MLVLFRQKKKINVPTKNLLVGYLFTIIPFEVLLYSFFVRKTEI